MGNYTPEQVESSAELFTMDHKVRDMLRAYAATLRQQAGRVDEGQFVAHPSGNGTIVRKGDMTPLTVDEILAAMNAAALAQNTQGDGEPVAWMGMQRNRLSCGPLGWTEAEVRRSPTFDTETDVAVPLYLHAERARVPDVDAMVSRFLGWTLPKDFAPDAGISFKPIPNPHGDPYPWPTGTNLLHAGQAKAMFEYVLAAAPSQRAEVKS